MPTEEQVRALHAAAPAGFASAIVLAAGVGLRAGEAAGLTVDRIDFLRREVRVDRLWHGRADRFEPVKSPASNRRVPASDEELACLSVSIAEHGTGEHGVILHAGGRPLNANRMGWRWEQTVKAAGVAMKYHDLRHHFASSLLSAGCSIVAVQRALGHSAASIMLNTYGHLMPSDHDRIRAATGAAWQSEDSMRTEGGR